MNKFFVHKWKNFEFWPYWLFYLPFVPWWLWFGLRSGRLNYFMAVNPGMEYGGFYNYSKYKIIEQLPDAYKPVSILLEKQIKNPPMEFPFIVKPDTGERGKDVSLIHNEDEWKVFIGEYSKPYIIQEYLPQKFEFGVFYVTMPDEKKGQVLSITGKSFLVYRGDGKTSLRDFIKNNPRAYYRKEYLEEKYKFKLDNVLRTGEEMLLEPIGNHNRGTYFFDASHLITKELTTVLDDIRGNISRFNYGRLDVKAETIEDFQKGNFKIMEINGANSEATHIYDNRYDLFTAYREVFRHLKWQFKIAEYELKKGTKIPGSAEFIKLSFKRTWIAKLLVNRLTV